MAAGLMAGLAMAVPASAAGSNPAPATINDIDGDGLLDVVYSSDGKGSDEDNGTLTIAYGDGSEQSFFGQADFGYPLPDPPLHDPLFGRWTQVADLNEDQYADIIVLGRGVDSSHSYVFIALGSATGLSLNRIQRVELPFARDEPSLAVVTEPDPLIVVSSPHAVVNGVESGALQVIPITPTGEAGTGQLISQDSAGIPGHDEAGDRFGASIAAEGNTLVVGSSGEDTTKADDTGMIHVLRRNGDTNNFTGEGFHQDTTAVPGSAEDGDHFGESVAIEAGHIAVGVPGEDLGGTTDGGMVVYFTDDGTTTTVADAFNQGSAGIPGSNEASDQFGQRVGFTRPCTGRDAILAGASEDTYDINRTTVVVLDPASSCRNKLLPGDAVTARSDAAANQIDSVIVAEWPDDPYAPPLAVERRFPYTSVVKQWGTGDIDGGLHLVLPMSR